MEHLYNYSLEELTEYFKSINEKPFRAKQVFQWLYQKNAFDFQEMSNISKDLREKLYAKIIHLPISYYSDQRKGDVMTKMLGDVGEVQNSFFQILELVVREPLTIVFSIVAMLAISVKLTLFVFAFIPISGFIISRIGKNLKSKSVRAQNEQGLFISTLDETLTGLKVVKSYNAEGSFIQKFNASLERLLKLSTSIANKNNLGLFVI